MTHSDTTVPELWCEETESLSGFGKKTVEGDTDRYLLMGMSNLSIKKN
jgi:hypothetical protein